ncbi:MAG TPA: FMN-binding glutamate synthase family protein [Firmicutes bacterium]|jgi:glutamate synthase domain-containing protein 2|nr:FMN-binding glutamate synthase family protein [Bacillota bacterium]
MLFSWIGRRIADAMTDSFLHTFINERYTESLYELVSTTQKMGVTNLVETAYRAEQGKPLSRPFGSVVALSPWNQLLFNPVHLWRLPTPETETIDTTVVIGPRAAKPLKLDIPILIAGMSFGGAVSEQVKIALARAASLMGTATNSGEAGLLASERAAAKYFIGQYNRGGWLNTPEKLRQLDAVEIQLGQGAQAATPQRTQADQIGPDYRYVFELAEGQDAVIHTRLPGVDSPQDFISLVERLRRETDGMPIGLKFCATHHLEKELEIAVKAQVDFITVDGHEGGTHGGSTTLQDDVGLPTLIALTRTVRYLEQVGARSRMSIIASGGLRTPGQMLKALALGADAVYIGTAAIMALVSEQMSKTVPFEPPTELVFYSGKLKEKFDIEAGVRNLTGYLRSAMTDIEHVVLTLGKRSVSELDRSDLVSLDRDLAWICGVDYAFFPPQEQWRLHDAVIPPAARTNMLNGGARDGGKHADGVANVSVDGKHKIT